MVFNFDFFASEPEEQNANTLIQYLQQQHPDTTLALLNQLVLKSNKLSPRMYKD